MSAAVRPTPRQRSRFEASRETLAGELALVASIIEPVPASAAYSLVSMAVHHDALTLAATDGQLYLAATVRGVSGEAEMSANGRTIAAIVRALEPGTVSFERLPCGSVKVTGGASQFLVFGTRDFVAPDVPVCPASAVKVEAGALRDVIEGAAYAMATESLRYTLGAVKLEIRSGCIRAVATDGKRLAMVERSGPDASIDALIERKSVAALLRMIRHEGGVVRVASDEARVYFATSERLLATMRLAGAFPAYGAMIPAGALDSLTVNRAELVAAVSRVGLLSEDRTPVITFTAAGGELALSSSGDCGDAREVIECHGSALSASFLRQYVSAALTHLDGDEIEIAFARTGGQFRLSGVGATAPARAIAVLMPVT